MHFLRKHLIYFISLTVLIVVVSGLFPFCQYYVDPDGTSYLTICERYAAGNLATAVNGYWSPFSCWLTAILMSSCDINTIPASIIINAIGAAGFLAATHSFFIRFLAERFLHLCLLLSLSLFLAYAVYFQTFADLWQCFFLLAGLRLLIANSFRNKAWLWMAYGFLGSMAYYSKAYAFPFFIINTVVCLIIKSGILKGRNKTRFFTGVPIILLSFIAGCIPWITLLTQKYHHITTGSAGSLNLSWYVVGHPIYKDGIDILLPPPYVDSHYYWEDPLFVNGDTPHFWSSFHMLRLQAVKVILNLLKLVRSMNELSAFYMFTYIAAILAFIKPTSNKLHVSYKAVAATLLLFPLGFLLINYESRYLWFTIPLSMIVGAYLMQQYWAQWSNKSVRVIASLIFAASYLIYPALNSRVIFEGATEYSNAQAMKQRNIVGSSFAAGGELLDVNPRAARLAYFSGNSFYVAGRNNYNYMELLRDLRKCQIHYFVYFYKDAIGKEYQLMDESGSPFPEIKNDGLNGMKIFEITAR